MHYDWKCTEAEREYQRALSLNPSYATAHQWRAINLLATGHANDSIQELKSAQALDPASLIIMADTVEMEVLAGRLQDAEPRAEGAGHRSILLAGQDLVVLGVYGTAALCGG